MAQHASSARSSSRQDRHSSISILHGVFGDAAAQILSKKGYKLGKVIGEGSYCKVRLSSKVLDGGEHVKIACKIINRKKASHDFVTKFLPRELDIIRHIDHPNIVKFYDIIDINDCVYIFMEYCDRGDLLEHIRSKGALKEPKGRHYFRQLVSAVKYLHALDITHRDLKCENVLLVSDRSVKLTDFGFCRRCRDDLGKRVLSKTFCGSAAYAAPEILQGQPYNPKMYDVWSLGCILYIMVTATMPFDDSNIKKMLRYQQERRLGFNGKNPEPLTTGVKRLIRHMLEPDITRRATMDQVAADPWIYENDLHAFSGSHMSSLSSLQAADQ